MKSQPSSVLSRAHFAQLITALESTEKPLGSLCAALWSPANKFSPSALALGTTLAALLQDALLPTPPSRLVAIYVLYDLIATPRTAPPPPPNALPHALHHLIHSPLSIILFELLETPAARAPEQLLLSHLLTHSQSPSDDPVPGQIAQAPAVTLWGALEGALKSGASVPKLNMGSLRRLWTQLHPDPPARPLPPVSGVVPDAEPFGRDAPLVEQMREVVTLRDFSPKFVRPAPRFLPLGPDTRELRWVDPEPMHELVWDPEMGLKGERGSELRELMAKAFKSPIPEAQQEKVLLQLEGDAKLVHLCGLTPQKLPDLVKNNSSLATEILLKLVSSNQMPQYYAALVGMELNMHSMEVVTRLTNQVKLPTEFVHTYTSNCIRSCGNIPDKYDQIRMVRFVCVFLKSLIKNKIIDVQDLFIEVQAFCIEYSRYAFNFRFHLPPSTPCCCPKECILTLSSPIFPMDVYMLVNAYQDSRSRRSLQVAQDAWCTAIKHIFIQKLMFKVAPRLLVFSSTLHALIDAQLPESMPFFVAARCRNICRG